MQYLGGKTRIAKAIAEEVNRIRKPGEWVWEPFCGGLSVSVALSKAGPVWATDANPALIALYQAVQNGWVPPSEVSEAAYHAAKLLPDSDPLKAFAGFGCAFGGKWFGGYAREASGRDYAQTSRRVLLRQIPAITAPFARIDFLRVEPRPIAAKLYCDPPYYQTTGYGKTGAFDSARFCAQVARWSQFTDVFVSEYWLPIGEIVLELQKAKTVAGGSGGGRVGTERLYLIRKGSL